MTDTSHDNYLAGVTPEIRVLLEQIRLRHDKDEQGSGGND